MGITDFSYLEEEADHKKGNKYVVNILSHFPFSGEIYHDGILAKEIQVIEPDKIKSGECECETSKEPPEQAELATYSSSSGSIHNFWKKITDPDEAEQGQKECENFFFALPRAERAVTGGEKRGGFS